MRGPDTITEENIAGYFRGIDLLQSELKQRGTKFLDGDQPGFADFMVWPWFERLLVINSDIGRLDEKNYKLVVSFATNLGTEIMSSLFSTVLCSYYTQIRCIV